MTRFFGGLNKLDIDHIFPKIKITADRKVNDESQISKEFADYIYTLTTENPEELNWISLTAIDGLEISTRLVISDTTFELPEWDILEI